MRVNSTVFTRVVSFTWRCAGAFRITGGLSLVSRTRMFTMVTVDFGIPMDTECNMSQEFAESKLRLGEFAESKLE